MLKLAAQIAEPGMLQVVLMGIITVFVVLVCLIAIIKILGAVMEMVAGKKAAQPAAPAASAAPQAASPDKRQLVAAISAAIAEDMGSDVDHIRIHSIRKL